MNSTASTSRYAVIGNPINHSRSPHIHALFAEQTHQRLIYDAILSPIEGFKETVLNFFDQGGQGLNVTLPFKKEAYVLAQNNLSVRAKIALAVNTLWMQAGVLHGCNTDGVGLINDLLRLNISLKNARLLLIGAGGAACGILQPLIEAGCAHIHLVNRNEARAQDLITHWKGPIPATTQLTIGSLATLSSIDTAWNIVINATASALSDNSPLNLQDIHYAPNALAYDLMYSARPTAFMRQAALQGATYVSEGLGMLVNQAAESFFIWHGVRPNVETVLATLRQGLS